MRICLEFSHNQNETHRRRLSYAFQLFCAVYGHAPLFDPEDYNGVDVVIRYELTTGISTRKNILQLSNLYRPRSPLVPAPSPKQFSKDDESTALFYSPSPGQQPDWLGEIFEWVSCADEYSIQNLDSCGRVPFEACYIGRHKLNARVPYAAVAMRFLERALNTVASRHKRGLSDLARSAGHFIVATHDVDYLPVGRLSSANRLAKNAAVSWLEGKSVGLAVKQVQMALRRTLNGHDPLDQISELVRGERQRGIGSSYYFLTRHLHRRDANYTSALPGFSELLSSLESQGMEVGIHGSYRCLEEGTGLACEYQRLQELGFRPKGGRQHWLRFTLARLIPSLERSGALYDTSIGWIERIGYRAGACFPFPPYYFQEERPAKFIELPMAAMDLSLRFEFGGDYRCDGYAEVSNLLDVSRQFGWGGISILWHPAAFGGAWIAPEIGEIYWRLLDHCQERNDKWLSAAEFLQLFREEYVRVGLLPEFPCQEDSERAEQPVEPEGGQNLIVPAPIL